MVKTILFLAVLFSGFYSFGFSCNENLDDPTGLSRCLYNLIQHRKNFVEKHITQRYKTILENRATEPIHYTTFIELGNEARHSLEKIHFFNKMLELISPEIERVRITNVSPIPTTCSQPPSQ